MTPFRSSASLAAIASALLVSLTAYVPMVITGHITRDSGVFLYTGMVTSRGGMPYVDSWDHKGPLLAVIESLAWRLGGGIIGAPILEAIVLFLGLACAGVIWSRWIRGWAVLAVLVVGVTYLAVFEGGNFTETWLFPFQLVAYSAAAHLALRFGRDAPARPVCAVGLLVGLAVSVGLYTRMNNVVGLVLIAVVGFVALRRRVIFGCVALAVVLGIGLVLGLWLWTGDALRAGIDQYVRYNVFYSGGTPAGERLGAFAILAQLLVSGAITVTAVVAFVAWFISRKRTDADRHRMTFVISLFVIVGGVDSLSQMVSGRPYPHYLVVGIAGFAVSAVVAGAGLLKVFEGREDRPRIRLLGLPGVAALGIAALVLSSSTATALQGLRTVTGAGTLVVDSYQAQLVDRVIAETTPDDRVLVHGAETWILAAAQRLSPTSVTYSLPVEQGYGGLPSLYLSEITSFPPALIVESPSSCGISQECPPEKAQFAGLAQWVVSNYVLEGDVVGFRFWRYKSE